ncbi:hypothetical protein LguiA_006163 [Lonicera macranthoides]
MERLLSRPHNNAKVISCSSSVYSSSSNRFFDNNLGALYEVTYLPENEKIFETNLPLVNLYDVFSKPNTQTFSKSVKKLFSRNKKLPVKEYVHSSRIDQNHIPAGSQEQFVTILLPDGLVRISISQGYTHFHFRTVCLALTFHGRKGIPAVSRIALLDSQFPEYHNAYIGTI